MRRLSLLLFIGLVTVVSLAGCSDRSFTATVGASNSPQLSPTATFPSGAPTSTPSSHPVSTDTPPSGSHQPTRTPTPSPTVTNCGSITATTENFNTTTQPSNPQPLEDCFTNAWNHCQSTTLPAKLALTFIDSTGKTVDALRTPPSKGACEMASVTETKYAPDGSITTPTTTFTCLGLVPSGQKWILKACSNNAQIGLP
jgi:hypothetical protein